MEKDPAAVSLGRRGGLARGVLLRAGIVARSGQSVAKPTRCARCGVELPSARAAWRHCRQTRIQPRKLTDAELTAWRMLNENEME